MRILLRSIVLLAVLASAAALVLAWLALSAQPVLLEIRTLGPEDVARARAVLKQNDPRRLPSGATGRIVLSERELNLAANYLLQSYANGGTRIELQPDRAQLAATVRLPLLPLRPFLNLRAELLNDRQGLRVSSLGLGALALPDQVAQWLLDQVLRQTLGHLDYRKAYDAIEDIQLGAGEVAVAYRWRPELLDTVREGLVPAAQREAIVAYRRKLAELHRSGVGTRGSVTGVLQPLFAYAQARSDGRDPVIENRALLLVLGTWAGGRGLESLLPQSDEATQPHRFRLRLERRHDFAQHFLVSAGLAANGDGALANAVGLFKELSDVDRGSGFSFSDIAADRAGTRFGELAVRTTDSARRLQSRLASPVREADLAPSFRDLPEHLTDAEFARRYGAVGSPRYLAVMAEIERRLDATPLLYE